MSGIMMIIDEEMTGIMDDEIIGMIAEYMAGIISVQWNERPQRLINTGIIEVTKRL